MFPGSVDGDRTRKIHLERVMTLPVCLLRQIYHRVVTTLRGFEPRIPTRQVGVIDHFTIRPVMVLNRTKAGDAIRTRNQQLGRL